jgi:hypothetical protein
MAISAQLKMDIIADASGALPAFQQTDAAIKKTEQTYEVFNNTLNQSVGYQRQAEDRAKRLAEANTALAKSSTQASAEVEKATSSTGGFVKGANEAYGAIRKLAYVLPGIGIGGLVAVGFEVLAASLEAVIPAIGGTSKAIENLNKVFADSGASVAGEVASLKSLVAIATDETRSRVERARAFKELQDMYPQAFKNMSLEKTSTAELTKAVDDLSVALIRQARIKGLENAISKVAAEQAELLAGSMKDVVKQAGVLGTIQSLFSGNPADLFVRTLGESQDKMKALQEQLHLLISDSIKLDDNTLLSHKADKAVKIKVVPEVDEQEIKQHPLRLGTFLDVRMDEQFKVLQTKMDKHPMLLTLTADAQKANDLYEIAKNTGEKFGAILTQNIDQSISHVAGAIGGALGSGGNVLASAGKALLQSVGSLLQELGKGLIKIGVIEQALQSLGKLSPALQIAIGIGAEIAGAALISSAGKAHAFAEGGVVTGPTLGLVGEAGPEVIFPLDKLNRFVQGGPQGNAVNVTGNFQLRGTDLMVALARAQKNQNNV